MADLDTELEATLARTKKLENEADALRSQVEEAARAIREWREAHGITPETEAKFHNALSPEDRKKAEEEQDQFQREVQHDLDAALERAGDGKAPARPGPRQSRSLA